MPLTDTAIRAVESLDKPQKLFNDNGLLSAWKKPESRQLSILPPPFRLKQGIFLFPSGVRSIWLHYNLAYMKQRLTALKTGVNKSAFCSGAGKSPQTPLQTGVSMTTV
ncbi:hypothetical protein [uncultured Desulfovibrio sp.]|uniref:hypothetical protein n=1 Tax=uncultured Desulfovibrio sp. TaxID=167968 RepID=UPI00266FEC6C|nr:hypothetical protein [uncultured Desulfovibrio sp.]